MRRLINFFLQLVVLALVVFLFTAAWIVFDGLIDAGGKADVALVTGRVDAAPGMADAKLDRVIELYNGGEFPYIIVSGSRRGTAKNDPAEMAKYLESHGISSDAIIEDLHGETTVATSREVAEIMKSHQFQSVMLVTDYYRMTRTKLVLSHDGVQQIEKAHVGKFQKEDVWDIGREVVALYDYIGRVYLMPAALKAKEEAQSGIDKAKVDAETAKEKVDKGLDGLAK